MDQEPRVVPFAAYEAQSERNVRTIKHMSIGWAVSVITLAMLCLVSTAYTSEVVTETSETETIERVAEADNMGNAIVGDGEITIGDSTANDAEGQNDQNYSQG